jgi:regulator of cell morphogenesis and NO signaling
MSEIVISGSMKMADIIMADQRAMVLMPRFGIEMGFGDKTVKQICQQQGIQLDFFLLMVNIFLHPHYFPNKKLKNVDVKLLLLYLANAHDYYIREKIPALQWQFQGLMQELSHPAKSQLDSFFNDYIQEVIEHIEYEEQVVFPYIESLVMSQESSDDKNLPEYGIREFEERHHNIEEKLSDLKNLLIKYFPPDNGRYRRIRLLNELFDLEQDLTNHARLEDKVLIPIVEDIEKQNSGK